MGNYPEVDVSRLTDSEYSAARIHKPIGTCLHTSGGTNSRQVLQGLDQSDGRVRSAHVLIGRTGKREILVPDTRCAYHTGSTWWHTYVPDRMDGANEVLLGIELECLDAQFPTFPQLDSAAEYITQMAWKFSWRWPVILYGHYGLALPIGRRSDPVRLDWGALFGRIYFYFKQQRIGGL